MPLVGISKPVSGKVVGAGVDVGAAVAVGQTQLVSPVQAELRHIPPEQVNPDVQGVVSLQARLHEAGVGDADGVAVTVSVGVMVGVGVLVGVGVVELAFVGAGVLPPVAPPAQLPPQF